MRTSDRPDVLLISVDTMRRDCMAPYGHDLMPEATRLLQEGLAFDRCVAAAPWTGPSFGTMLSGLWSRQHGCLANEPRRGAAAKRSPLSPAARTLAEMLHDAGYHTICIQGNTGYLGPGCGFEKGFDEYVVWVADRFSPQPVGGIEKHLRALRFAGLRVYLKYLAARERRRPWQQPVMRRAGSLARAAARRVRRAPRGRPLFLWINFMDMHEPYCAPRRWMPPSEAPGKVRLVHLRPATKSLKKRLTEADKQYVRRRYHNTARYVNACMAGLITRWAGWRSARSTMTVFTSDHGEEFWDHGDNRADPLYYRRGVGHGHTLFSEQLRVPLVFHWPEGGIAGRRVDQLVSLADVTPTLVELLGLDENTSSMAGRSLAPFATSPPEAGEDGRVVFADSIIYGAERQAAISASHKLVVCPETRERNLFAWGQDDPEEKTDLIGRPEHADTAKVLTAALADWNALLANVRPPPSPPLSPEEEQFMDARLRDLGYL